MREPLVIDTEAGLAIAREFGLEGDRLVSGRGVRAGLVARVPAALISNGVQTATMVSREIGWRAQPEMRVRPVQLTGMRVSIVAILPAMQPQPGGPAVVGTRSELL